MKGLIGELLKKISYKIAFLFKMPKKRPRLNQSPGKVYYPPGHYYSPLPSIEELKLNEDEIFNKIPTKIPGIYLNKNGQLDLLNQIQIYYGEQPWQDKRVNGLRYYFDNNQFRHSDAIFLFLMIRHFKPSKIVEVGSGFSSSCILDTNELFFGNSISLTFIDPDPNRILSLIKDGDREKVEIIPKKVQEVGKNKIADLSPGDFLFIDSSHVTKTGSDVNYVIFEILPLLKKGVHIHFHDIFYPFEYPKEWIYEGWGVWNEAYLIRAFLQYNQGFHIELFTSYMDYFHGEKIMKELPLCSKGYKASLWIRKGEN
ncbi:MAG: class I SAM-dependent methyltransferase [Candidatus Dadabacteria bacterium]|nr:class I SAM-dependent methyltransferase [Candidatus Dadabacteria bacterium]NIQ13657.1 class I SAM-dependent methyltransferase [Candidatus Dadabacteria bacterium]